MGLSCDFASLKTGATEKGILANKYEQILSDMLEDIYGEGVEPRSDVDVLGMIKSMESGVIKDHALNSDISDEELDRLIAEESMQPKNLTVEEAELQAKVHHLVKSGLGIEKISHHLLDEHEIMVSTHHIREILYFPLSELKSFRNRALSSCYPIVYIDSLDVKMLTEFNIAVEHPFYIIVGMNTQGGHELLAVNAYKREFATEEAECAMWQEALIDLKQRGFSAPIYMVTGSVKGFKQALQTVYPGAIYQRSLNDILTQAIDSFSTSERVQFSNEYRALYHCKSLLECMKALGQIEDKWKEVHPEAIKYIREHFVFFEQYFAANATLRTSIRTTKPVGVITHEVRRDIRNDRNYGYRDSLQSILRILEVSHYLVKDIKPVQWKRALKSILDDPYTGKMLQSHINPKDIQLSRRSLALQKAKMRKAEEDREREQKRFSIPSSG